MYFDAKTNTKSLGKFTSDRDREFRNHFMTFLHRNRIQDSDELAFVQRWSRCKIAYIPKLYEINLYLIACNLVFFLH